ncbi:MAG: hypothetical protein E4H36_11215 [Spirochaetales bacterium]|nr:MAG: hypothetical protein E4H36_11215 [Spirochaetales bacterium]
MLRKNPGNTVKVPLFGGGEWTIIEEGFDAARVPAGESVFSLANGSLGIRYSFEEGSPVYKPGTYVNGFYENLPITYGENAFGFPLEKQTILTLPDAASLKLFVNGEPFSMEHGRLLSHTRILDMKSAAAAR